jgi:hypothetical protein
MWRCDPTQVMAFSFLRFLDHTQRRTTVGRTPMEEWSARRRDLYLTTHNTHNRQTSMPPVGFEPTISAGERPQTYVLDRTATGTGIHVDYVCEIFLHILRAGCTYQNTLISFGYGPKMLTLLAKSLPFSNIYMEIFAHKIFYPYIWLFSLDLLVHCILLRTAEVKPFWHVL